MASNAPKDTAPSEEPVAEMLTDAPPADDEPKTTGASDEPRVGVEHPADGTPSPEISNDPAPADPADDTTDGAATLVSTIQGNLIILSGTGFESGTRYDVRFQRPDGSIDNTVAVAKDDGALTTYATVKSQGKHVAWLEKLGEKVAELKFKV